MFIGVRLLLKKESVYWLHYGGLALTTVIYAFCYGSISYALGKSGRLQQRTESTHWKLRMRCGGGGQQASN